MTDRSAQLARDLGLSRTDVSNHLACLRGCGIVVAALEGPCLNTWTLNQPRVVAVHPARGRADTEVLEEPAVHSSRAPWWA